MQSQKTRRKAWLAVPLSLGLLAAAACGDDSSDGDPTSTGGGDSTNGSSARIEGAGATFPNPVFTSWIFEYSDSRADNPVNTDLSVDYQSIGSGGGIAQFLEDTVDWGTSERYLRDEDIAEAQRECQSDPIQLPLVFGSVVIAFNDDQLDNMILDADTIAAIFQREITTYNDERLQDLNPDMDLPDTDIIPVHRSDGSGTTSVFTTFLDHEVDSWELGADTEVDWPDGTLGGDGNEGVTAGIQQNPGGLGYINQAYALENDIAQARVINSDGNPVYPTLEATTAAVEEVDAPEDYRFDILDIGGDGFPITGTAWNFFYTCGYDDATTEALKEFWTWATQSEEADDLARELGYSPLAGELKERVAASLERINEEG